MFERKCPECAENINYKHKWIFTKACNYNTICEECKNKTVICSNPSNNPKCKGISQKRTNLCHSCVRYSKPTSKKGKIYHQTLIYQYPCCNKKTEMSIANVNRAISENRKCKSCHMKMMHEMPKFISEESREQKRIYFKENNPSFKPENKEKISKRMTENNPVTQDGVLLKMRLAAQRQRELLIGQYSPMYNPKSITIIEQYGLENEYNFQHAENGGEFHIKELGYWVDGYDEENNVVIEFDEIKHFHKNGKLKEKDINRQCEIMKFLKCKFIRIKYDGTITIFEND